MDLIRRAWRRDGAIGRCLHVLLLPVSWLYALGAAAHRAWRASRPRYVSDVPVIIVGNLSVGGTGKTPVVEWIAADLCRAGRRVAVVSRGYGGSRPEDPAVVSDGRRIRLGAAAAGDEPVMLARALAGVGVVVGRDRVAAAALAVRRLRADVLILDDGFQQRSRFPGALRLLVVHGRDGLGVGLLPAGPLREPASSVADADLVVMTRGRTAPLPVRRPVIRCDHRFAGLAGGGSIRGRTVVALSGIGDPAGFEAMLRRESGARRIIPYRRPDHHQWTIQEVREASGSGGAVVVTTAKDVVRLPAGTGVLVARLRLAFARGDERRLRDLIREHVRR